MALVRNIKVNATVEVPNAIQRTLDSKVSERISILDFGVVDDGVTDNAAAIQACFDAVASTYSSAEVFIPASKHPAGYFVGTTLLVPSGVNIRGEGRGSQLRATSDIASGESVLRLDYDGNTIGRYIRDIAITGNNSCNGIDTNVNSTDTVIRQVYGWAFDHVSVNEVDTAYRMAGLWHSQLIACQAGTCRVGLLFLGQCVSVLVTGGHFACAGGPLANSFGIRIMPEAYAWNGGALARPEAIIVNGETMCIAFQYGVYIDDGLDIHLSNLDLDYCHNRGVVVQNVNGGFSLVNSWIAAYGEGTSQFIGVDFPGATTVQAHKLVQGVHINALNNNSVGNNIGIQVGPGSGKVAIRDCTIGTGGESNSMAIGLFSNTAGTIIDGCILGNARLYLQSSGNVSVQDCYLTSINEVFKAGVNYYSGNIGLNTDGLIEVPFDGAANSAQVSIPNIASGMYLVTAYANDSAASADRAYISGGNIVVTRPTSVGVPISSWVKYTLV